MALRGMAQPEAARAASDGKRAGEEELVAAKK